MSDLNADLEASRVARAEMQAKFGFVPNTLLRLTRGTLSRRMWTYQTENPTTRFRSGGDPKSARASARQQLGLLGGRITKNNADNNRQALSIMAAELVQFFVRYYAKPGDTYLDPFAGQGIQMQVAKLEGLHYRGYDLSELFVPYIQAVARKIDDGKTTIRIIRGDSRNPDQIPDGVGDFCFTSPPYWDIEFYGDDPSQLGTNHTYPEFLAGMEAVARAWLPKFKPGAYVVVNVNDFRRDGKFYPYHADTIALFIRAGWELTDTWIVDGLIAGLVRAFAVDKNNHKIAPRVHEYALVFRRPE